MSNLPRIVELATELQELAKKEWGIAYLDCDCVHETGKCGCFMCESGWSLTEYREIHEWEKELLPIITARNPAKYLDVKKEQS